jgi:hypothetical protein
MGYPRVTGSDLDSPIDGSLQDLASSQVRGTRDMDTSVALNYLLDNG